ncbi:hypothetical protein SOVF_009660 [Spinacia oleracea]|nr:hypothetical protein SOVF_009660 [Spinacia oleracea]
MGEAVELPSRLGILAFRNKVLFPGAMIRIRCTSPSRGDLDFAYDSISAFSGRRDNQEAVFGAEEGLKEIRDETLAYKTEALELQRQLS